jgi:hypothetical protein
MTEEPTAEDIAGSTLGSSILKPPELKEELAANVDRVVRNAGRRLGSEGLARKGRVPLKVLKAVHDEGMVAENELEAEYLGGVLASSRSEIDRDDRAASLIGLVGRLSTYQLRTHYIMYAQAQAILSGSEFNIGFERERDKFAQCCMPFNVWLQAMEFTQDEMRELNDIFGHSINGLLREELIGSRWTSGSPDVLREEFRSDADYPGMCIVFTIAPLGVELFTAAHGKPETAFLGPTDNFEIADPIQFAPGFALVHELPTYTPPNESGESA